MVTPTQNFELLKRVAAKLRVGGGLWSTKWQNSETETVAEQAIRSCEFNLREHGDALSWASQNVFTDSRAAGVENGAGLRRLIREGDIIMEPYEGHLTPTTNTARKAGKPLVLRVTDKLLEYAAVHMGLPVVW